MTEPNEYIFEKLTPITDGDISVYESAINFVFKHNDVKNVAISGAYGAGKSSVLASYKAKHSDKNSYTFLWHIFKAAKRVMAPMCILKILFLRGKYSIS